MCDVLIWDCIMVTISCLDSDSESDTSICGVLAIGIQCWPPNQANLSNQWQPDLWEGTYDYKWRAVWKAPLQSIHLHNVSQDSPWIKLKWRITINIVTIVAAHLGPNLRRTGRDTGPLAIGFIPKALRNRKVEVAYLYI